MLVLLAAARLRIGGRRLRALATGDGAAVRAFVSADSALRLSEARRDARADLATLERFSARLIALGDPAYPPGLRELKSAPAFLCVRGNLPDRGIAIVGARDAGEAACRFAFELARALGRAVVSGLARGIDAAAHRGALAAGLAQVAYVGTGIARTFPPEHAALAEEIVAGGGSIASERLPDEEVSRWALVQRDRLQAAHAAGVVLVESELGGGAMHTLRFARELGRPCFVRDVPAGGNQAAIAAGALALDADVATAVRAIVTRLPSPKESA
jgi:DNA processing protein